MVWWWQQPRRALRDFRAILLHETRHRDRGHSLQGQGHAETAGLVQETFGASARSRLGRLAVPLARAEESEKKGFYRVERVRRRHGLLQAEQETVHVQFSRRQSEAGTGQTEAGEGVWVDPKTEETPDGKFGWIMDCEDTRIELWEPPR
jgi:hypothetical protein